LFPRRRAGEILVADGVVTERDVAFALRLQRKERLERLFLLGDARVSFHVARGAGSAPSPLGKEEFLHGRSRFGDRGGCPAPEPLHEDHASYAGASGGGVRRDPVRSRALATLGLRDDAAGTETVQRAFRKLAASLHPDRFPTANAVERADLMRRF